MKAFKINDTPFFPCDPIQSFDPYLTMGFDKYASTSNCGEIKIFPCPIFKDNPIKTMRIWNPTIKTGFVRCFCDLV